jgi:hypothetical protein
MLTMNEIRTLVSRPEQTGNSTLTVYLDLDQSRQANLNRGFEHQLKEMLSNLRETIPDQAEAELFIAAARRVEDFVAQYQIGARGLIVVADASDGFFWSHRIDFPIANQVRWNQEVFLQPLAVAVDELEQAGIVLLDRANLRLFTMFLGELREHIQERFEHKKVRHTRTVGMDHIGSASHAQRKADEQIRANLKQMIKDIDSLLDRHGVKRVILAGSPEITAELKALLPKRLADQVIGSVDIAINATLDDVRRAAAPIAETFERHTEEAVVTNLVTSAAKSGRVTIGLGHTLHALNQHRVWQLIYADGYQASGYECPRCNALFALETASCALCGSTLTPTENVVERAVDHAMRKGVKIEAIRGEEPGSSLMNAGGIGALLKTRTSRVRVS